MKLFNWKSWLIGTALSALVFVPSQAMAIPTGLELLLLVDVSGSVDSNEYNLQKTGYINAFNDAGIQALITGTTGGIAVAYAEWSGSSQQSLLVNWMQLTDATTSSAFATAIGATSRAFSGSTGPGSAINWGVPLFNNNFEGTRSVIDVSGDGAQNTGANTFNAATAALAAGITVNGLAIGGGSLPAWYQANIVTPGGGFLVTANNFSDFSDAVKTKIGREITPSAASPSVLLLMGIGFAAMGLAHRRRNNG